jgi:hypothetical protein
MISFRKVGPSGRGQGRIRFYVDVGEGTSLERCIGSIEGKTGDYSLDFDMTGSERYRTRLEAAEALRAHVERAEAPPIGHAEHEVLKAAQQGRLPPSSPSRSMARMLSSRGLLTAEFKLTPDGRKAIEKYKRWTAARKQERTAT